MEFRFDDDQLALSDTVRRFCAARFSLEDMAAREERPVDREVWAELANLGVFGLLLPEPAGESVYGAVGAAIVFTELGSHLASGPLVWSVLAGPIVDGAADGTALVGGLDRAGSDGDAATGGVTGPVEHAGALDALLILDADGVRLVGGDALPEPTELVPMDPLTPMGAYADLPPGEAVGGPEEADRLRVLGTTLSAAMAVGVAERALEVARVYALEREQFDVPIGSFQAVKHMLADMYVRTNLARSAAFGAAAVMDEPGTDDPVRAAASAKLLAGTAAIENGTTAIQILGGMGFTWDMLPNYLLKRGWVLETAFGTGGAHALTIADSLESEVA